MFKMLQALTNPIALVLLSPLVLDVVLATTPNPSATIPLSDIFPSSFPMLPSTDFSCWTSHVSFALRSSSIYYADEKDKLKFTYTDSTYTNYGDYTITRPSPQTTLCDGSPRVTGPATPTGSATLITQTIKTTWTSTWVSNYLLGRAIRNTNR